MRWYQDDSSDRGSLGQFSTLEIFELAAPDQMCAGGELPLCSHRFPRCGDIAYSVAVKNVDEDVGRQLGILGAKPTGVT